MSERPFGLVLVATLAACQEMQSCRFGAGVGLSLASVEADSTGFSSAESLSFDTRGEGGFAEVMVTGVSADLLLRLSAQESRGDIAGVASEGRVETQRAAVLVSLPYDLFGTGALRPFFGLSVGHLEVEFDERLPYERGDHLIGGIVLGLEYELAGHVLVGGSLNGDLFGVPGTTDGTLVESLLYVGERF